MRRQIIKTKDGSTTIHLPDWNEHYHSTHGALQEAQHVFINNGLHHIHTQKQFSKLDILEIGFGTGLNALLTYATGASLNLPIQYTGIEGYPVSLEEIARMNYAQALQQPELQEYYLKMHNSPWESTTPIAPTFDLIKRKQLFDTLEDHNAFDLIYFDAFGARVQPELWEVEIFEIMYNALKAYGVLVTYAAKGSARRAMQTVGFTTERLPGPPGKREMLRATKS